MLEALFHLASSIVCNLMAREEQGLSAMHELHLEFSSQPVGCSVKKCERCGISEL